MRERRGEREIERKRERESRSERECDRAKKREKYEHVSQREEGRER
jgi:hypothetical protein